MEIKAELHCHNIYSNFHLGKDESPYDCNIAFREQLERSKELGLNALFVTNHNTLDGYTQLLRYKNDHDKFKEIQIYPAEEVTIDSGAHVLVYGIGVILLNIGMYFVVPLLMISKKFYNK